MKRNFLISTVFFFVGHFVFAQQDLKLWYSKPSAKWTDALPIGNGRLGAMIFGGVDTDRIQFNEETLWTGQPRDYNRKGAYKYLPELRQLLFDGKQKEAEQLAEEHFMGMESGAGDREAWLNKVRSEKNLVYASAKLDDSKWKEMRVPSYDGWEAVGFQGLDGAVWLRTSFDLPTSWKGEDLVLDLNRIRDQDFTYVNGKLVGSMDNTDPRKYVVPKETLVSGKNTIAIQVLNYFDKGGIAGYKDTSRHIGVYPKGKEDEKISLAKNWRYFIQNDNAPATQHYQADYQPFGDVWLQFTKQGAATNYRRELDISKAVARTSYSVNGVEFSREYIASQPEQVIGIHLTASKPGSISFDCLLNSPHKYSFTQKAGDNTLQLSVKVKDGTLKGECLLKLQTKSGKSVVQGNKIVVTQADEVTLYLAAATNFKNYKDITGNPAAICRNAIAKANVKSFDQVKASSIKEYQKYFNTLSVDFGHSENDKLPTDERIGRFASSSDPSLAALYMQYGRYLLISSSRPGTRPANLQGIWNDLLTPPWGSKYTTNINLEMNYWPSELLNLSPMGEPLFKMIDELAESGKETAREYYDAPGWVLHHNTDLWRGTAPINASNHGIWVGGSGWLSHHYWEHYLFTQDKSFLKNRAYPVMKQSALFYNSYLIKDPKTGRLISGPSNSPEHGGLVMGPSMDHEIIRSLFEAVISASEILNVDKSLRDTLRYKLSLIAPNQIGKYGQLQEWLQDVDDTADKHRHVSHLWAAYPGNEINWDDTPDFMKAARQSLIYRGDAATGWSLAWKINLWARFKDGNHTYKLLQMLLSPAEKFGEGSYHNLFDAHPPFQIDGNFGGAAGIGEMLIQSHTKYIDLLPALPSALPGGTIRGICARGGFRFDLKWNDGKLESIQVVSLAGNECLLRYNGKTRLFKTVKGKTYKLDGRLQLL